MAPVYQIYLKDELVEPHNISRKRTEADIRDILDNIIPSGIRPQRINPSNRGAFLYHQNDIDINYIYKPDIINKLKEKHFKAELTHDFKPLREIVVTDIPSNIYSRPEDIIRAEIEEKNSVKILLLSKFKSQSDNTYLYITLDSIETRDLSISKGTFNLFEKNLPVHKPHLKSRNSTTSNQQQQRPHT